MTCARALYLNPGSDFAETVTATDESGEAVDLTGYSASITDETGLLDGQVTASLPDAAAGQVRLAVTWDAAWPLLPGILGRARLLLAASGAESASLPFALALPPQEARVTVPRGSDMVWADIWPDDSEGADFTGQTLEIVNASATLAPLLTVAVTDTATRAYEIRLEGDPATPLGDAGTFQVRRSTAGADRRTTPPLGVTFE
jgi:hypothetical protein